MIQNTIAGLLIAGALFFLVRHYYKVFSGKKSACNCGTKHYTVKNGKLANDSCGGCCSCCSHSKKSEVQENHCRS